MPEAKIAPDDAILIRQNRFGGQFEREQAGMQNNCRFRDWKNREKSWLVNDFEKWRNHADCQCARFPGISARKEGWHRMVSTVRKFRCDIAFLCFFVVG